MVDKGALRPAFYDDVRSIWQKKAEEEAKKTGIDVEDSALSALSGLSGWEVLKRHIENLKKGLDLKMKEAVASGMSESEIGKSAVMSILAKDMLDSIISKVEDSALVVNEIQNERTEVQRSEKTGS
jgi:hypothetical protein